MDADDLVGDVAAETVDLLCVADWHALLPVFIIAQIPPSQ